MEVSVCAYVLAEFLTNEEIFSVVEIKDSSKVELSGVFLYYSLVLNIAAN